MRNVSSPSRGAQVFPSVVVGGPCSSVPDTTARVVGGSPKLLGSPSILMPGVGNTHTGVVGRKGKGGVIPSGVIVGNSVVFPNVLILTNPRQLATYRIRGDQAPKIVIAKVARGVYGIIQRLYSP